MTDGPEFRNDISKLTFGEPIHHPGDGTSHPASECPGGDEWPCGPMTFSRSFTQAEWSLIEGAVTSCYEEQRDYNVYCTREERREAAQALWDLRKLVRKLQEGR